MGNKSKKKNTSARPKNNDPLNVKSNLEKLRSGSSISLTETSSNPDGDRIPSGHQKPSNEVVDKDHFYQPTVSSYDKLHGSDYNSLKDGLNDFKNELSEYKVQVNDKLGHKLNWQQVTFLLVTLGVMVSLVYKLSYSNLIEDVEKLNEFKVEADKKLEVQQFRIEQLENRLKPNTSFQGDSLKR